MNKQMSILNRLPEDGSVFEFSQELIKRVTNAGFQWPDIEGPMEKISEEFAEFKAEVYRDPRDPVALEKELGDFFFTLCNIAYLLRINPDQALRASLQKFKNRFQHIECRLKEIGKTLETSNLQEMEHYWQEAKSSGK